MIMTFKLLMYTFWYDSVHSRTKFYSIHLIQLVIYDLKYLSNILIQLAKF